MAIGGSRNIIRILPRKAQQLLLPFIRCTSCVSVRARVCMCVSVRAYVSVCVCVGGGGGVCSNTENSAIVAFVKRLTLISHKCSNK